MITQEALRADTRIGFHYFPDTLHYREADLQTWLPEIKALGGSWLTLRAPNNRAIPESFLRGVMREYIEPVLHFHLPLKRSLDLENLRLLLNAYADWGVRYVALFDRPNLRSSWRTADWMKSDLVERFLDIYLPAADLVLQAGMAPVFPPMQPGGDYWDTAFLRAAIQGIMRRGHTHLLERLILGGYGWVSDYGLSWGAGGPERWPQSRPYLTPNGQEDQRGFYIPDWYAAITEAALGQSLPIILLGAGFNPFAQTQTSTEIDIEKHTQVNLAVSMLMLDAPPERLTANGALFPVSPHLLACNLWILAAASQSPEAGLAWYQPDGSRLPVVNAILNYKQNKNLNNAPSPHTRSKPKAFRAAKPISHYILLPRKENDLKALLPKLAPFIHEERPTMGFSIEEAALAARVTIAGDTKEYPDDLLEGLRSAGCDVKRIRRTGISIAPSLTTNPPQPLRGEL